MGPAIISSSSVLKPPSRVSSAAFRLTFAPPSAVVVAVCLAAHVAKLVSVLSIDPAAAVQAAGTSVGMLPSVGIVPDYELGASRQPLRVAIKALDESIHASPLVVRTTVPHHAAVFRKVRNAAWGSGGGGGAHTKEVGAGVGAGVGCGVGAGVGRGVGAGVGK
eukprot:CAMPEP_0185366578 /NCGR_PEP_ID=MMETSP1364-20130426/13804_1 /TAXON_ID=38817 /ORGANISM="Gephyrocapsa oceanica, Strain RCC1303" /LENGTH=162 /DNA_ID=CAMNT_0027967171 /DNA_START=114 /DNA_END=600 /DNA_ORIENTATION=+